MRSSDEILEYVNTISDKGSYQAFSVDIKDLFYSLPHDDLLYCAEESIDKFGSVACQNMSCVRVRGFLELLSFYLKSTFVQFEGVPHLQKQGVCIGSSIAPVLSNLFLACYDRSFSARLKERNAVQQCSERIASEIIEAELNRLGLACVISPSVALSKKELNFLRMRR